MIEPTLSNDILLEIGSYWTGHRLLYTCSALYAWWKPDRHAIAKSWSVEHDSYTESMAINRMPNGAYHGVCSNAWHYHDAIVKSWSVEHDSYMESVTITRMPNGECSRVWHHYTGATSTEIVQYNRGIAVSAVFKPGKFHRVSNLISGWYCSWKVDTTTIPSGADMLDALGCVDAANNIYARKRLQRNDVALRDFVAVANELLAQTSEHGDYEESPIMSNWNEPVATTR